MSMSVKNHQTEPTIRPDRDLGDMSQPCCMKAPSANQKELKMLNSLTVEDPVLPICEWLANCWDWWESVNASHCKKIYHLHPRVVFTLKEPPFLGREARDNEENNTHANVAEYHTNLLIWVDSIGKWSKKTQVSYKTYPDFLWQRIQETEHTGALFHWFLDHNGNAQRHEGLAEVYHSFSFRGNGHGSDCDVGLLWK